MKQITQFFGRLKSGFKINTEYRKHASAVALGDLNITLHFHFSLVSVDESLKEIKKLNPRKATQSVDVPLGDLKGTTEIFEDYIL